MSIFGIGKGYGSSYGHTAAQNLLVSSLSMNGMEHSRNSAAVFCLESYVKDDPPSCHLIYH